MSTHAADRPTVVEALPLVRALLRRKPQGCCLHVLLLDGNHDSAAWCARDARERGHVGCATLAEMLSRMSYTQIVKLTRRAHE